MGSAEVVELGLDGTALERHLEVREDGQRLLQLLLFSFAVALDASQKTPLRIAVAEISCFARDDNFGKCAWDSTMPDSDSTSG